MKFIRDLIEQKSSDAAVAEEAEWAEAPDEVASDLRTPFKAEDFYRIMDETRSSDSDTGDLEDEADSLDELIALEDAPGDHEHEGDLIMSDDAEEIETGDVETEENLVEEDAWSHDGVDDCSEEDDEWVAESDAPAEMISDDEACDIEPGDEGDNTGFETGFEPAMVEAAEVDDENDTPDVPVMKPFDEPADAALAAAAAVAPQEAEAPGAAVLRAVRPMAGSQPAEKAEDSGSAAVEVPAPAGGRGKGRAGRAKTRLLGFNSGMGKEADPFARASAGDEEESYTQFPVGWLVVIGGPGRGAAFTLFNGVSQIGRGESQTVRLDFGDNSISRENHAAIAFDAEQNAFFIGHGGKANLVRCNNMPVLSTQALAAGDTIRIGETTLRFMPLCGPEFSWAEGQKGQPSHAAHG
ncbi:FHA domain-containing protein [Marimonas arenosa]|uniref:FHA domain-containing protein n=1 Tax=Marimonas arenosa TaxID=1795305 RepID=A0AAE3WEH7_9RHOB|nr:FHA domain-containing protein [Marimonas arenosa]MDQ2090885.1 FHA domain-containing protein [Marimonas arenosa]